MIAIERREIQEIIKRSMNVKGERFKSVEDYLESPESLDGTVEFAVTAIMNNVSINTWTDISGEVVQFYCRFDAPNNGDTLAHFIKGDGRSWCTL